MHEAPSHDGRVGRSGDLQDGAECIPFRGPKALPELTWARQSAGVLGDHMVGEHAAGIIQMAATPVVMGAAKAGFDRTMAPEPSVAEAFVTMPD